MIRLNEIKMPLGATEEEVKKAAAKVLKIKENDIKAFSLARRSIDSRKKSDIKLIYSVEIETELNEESIIASFPTNKACITEKYDYDMLISNLTYNDYIVMEEKETRYGAVETISEGKAYAQFLKENEGVTVPEIEMFTGGTRAIVKTLDKNGHLCIFDRPHEKILNVSWYGHKMRININYCPMCGRKLV